MPSEIAMRFKIENLKDDLENEKKNLWSFTNAAAKVADVDKAAKFTLLINQTAARIQELRNEIDELIENSQKHSIQTE